MIIYLSAPLFTLAERAWNSSLANTLRRRGMKVLLPHEMSSAHDHGIHVFQKNVKAFQECDMVVAVLDQVDTDSGTSREVGYAYGIGKPILGIRTDFRGKADQFRANIMNHHACTTYIEFMEEDMRMPVGKIVQELERMEEMRLRKESMQAFRPI
ncbi:MAG: nucleoside 2-deoxyribosyltransferase [Deltaproteobacteria bacterium]|nr:nucleoside 2-deoxyribosyltransferase [Deltaproteobacteria bacterium]